MPAPQVNKLDTSNYVNDKTPLKPAIEHELRRRLPKGRDAVTLRDAHEKVFAILLTPEEFNFLFAMAEIAINADTILERASNAELPTMDLSNFDAHLINLELKA